MSHVNFFTLAIRGYGSNSYCMKLNEKLILTAAFITSACILNQTEPDYARVFYLVVLFPFLLIVTWFGKENTDK